MTMTTTTTTTASVLIHTRDAARRATDHALDSLRGVSPADGLAYGIRSARAEAAQEAELRAARALREHASGIAGAMGTPCRCGRTHVVEVPPEGEGVVFRCECGGVLLAGGIGSLLAPTA
jgi:hypothetical protein